MIWGDISRSVNGEIVLGGVAYKNIYIYIYIYIQSQSVSEAKFLIVSEEFINFIIFVGTAGELMLNVHPISSSL